MNIEELSKAQLLLLTVMVNFIVSIATGVLTVSLLDQAPIQISQGVDRVVEHTIQAVAAPVQVANPIVSNPIRSIATAIQPQPQQAPSTEQLLTAAIGNDAARTVLIYRGATSTAAIAFGTYLPKSHAVVTSFNGDLPEQATIAFTDGSAYSASLSKNTSAVAVYGFADNAKLPSAPDAVLPAASKLKAGQTVASLTKDSDAVTGIISKVGASTIDTSLVGVPAGAGVVDLSGQVVGIGSGSAGKLISADAILALLQDTSAK